MITKEDFTRVNNDVNGNPRYAFHFLELITDKDREEAERKKDISNGIFPIDIMYQIALKKARVIGGKKFHNKQYGGGIVIQSYNLDNDIKLINEL